MTTLVSEMYESHHLMVCERLENERLKNENERLKNELERLEKELEIQGLNYKNIQLERQKLCDVIVEVKRKNVRITKNDYKSFYYGIDTIRSVEMQEPINAECDMFQEFNEFVENLYRYPNHIDKYLILEKIQSYESKFTVELLKNFRVFYQSNYYYRNIKLIRVVKNVECPICMEKIDEKQIATTNCNHIFCKSCIIKACETKNLNGQSCVCPMCRTTIKNISIS
jgi:hypothetical protein